MRCKNGYEIRAQKFVELIFPFICDRDSYDALEEGVDYFNTYYHRNVLMEHGLTRVAFITSDYVVKMNFGYHENISQFGGCHDEFDMYEQAKVDGFEHLLAKPTLFEYEGIEFCIMPRIRNIGRFFGEVTDYLNEEDRDWVFDNLYDMHNKNYGWRNGYPVIFDYASNQWR